MFRAIGSETKLGHVQKHKIPIHNKIKQYILL